MSGHQMSVTSLSEWGQTDLTIQLSSFIKSATARTMNKVSLRLWLLQVRAHFSAIAAAPCPSLAGLCAVGEDCLVHPTSLPFNGTKPGSGWCVRQWQKTVPSIYSANISVGYET